MSAVCGQLVSLGCLDTEQVLTESGRGSLAPFGESAIDPLASEWYVCEASHLFMCPFRGVGIDPLASECPAILSDEIVEEHGG